MDKNTTLSSFLSDVKKAVDTKTAMEDFLASFKEVLSTYQKVKDDTARDRQQLLQNFSLAVADLQTKFAALQNTIDAKVAAMEAKAAALKNGLDGSPGKDADEERVIAEVLGRIKLPEQRAVIMDGPEEIRNKLELLTDEEELSAIRQLKEENKRQQDEIEALKRRPTGGGLSRIALEHAMAKMIKQEQFSTSSATTTISLANKVAGGVVIWLRYNGQMLHYGDHYTVSGSVVTFTISLDDNTTVDVTYLAA